MFGTIIGDVCGSTYTLLANNSNKSKDVELLPRGSRFTGETVQATAIADSILNGKPYRKALVEWYHLYPVASYGLGFCKWASSTFMYDNDSTGNAAAVRSAPVGRAFDTDKDIMQEAMMSAAPSHSSPDGIAGAQSVALSIFLARQHKPKATIRGQIMRRFGYELRPTVDEIRDSYKFNKNARESVPEAIICFLDSKDFIDTLRNALSLGGDARAQCSIACAIAEAYYGGVDMELWNKVKSLLPPDIYEIAVKLNKQFPLTKEE